MTSTRRAGVLGHPIAHSLSPALHRAAYQELGLDWDYRAFDVTEDRLPAFVAELDDDWAGLSLTMPLKVAAMPLVDFIEPMAKLVGAINTVVVQPVAGHRQLVGANTDVHGVVAALAEGGVERATSGVILGGGATATSALAALGRLGVTRPLVAVRNRARAGALMRAATKMGVEPRFVSLEDAPQAMAAAEAVVSTIPADAGALLGDMLGSVQPGAVLLDVVYEPLVTPLGAAWRGAGGVLVPGTRMLLHQALEQVRLMTGRAAPVTALEAVLAA
ncbi:shikimate dehydrogenase [Demequina activiva]|uniref:Shikimate 5-dehydrogenase n=1 Tax=Demequina activiva TaxID=1582364 RepID=A0A919Q1M5_9MICO|nr:shikimate dehydrogenase [Demequina activiva]GIG54630.1 shikimate 5-dehydrogenase [Demequina activiva]